MFTICDKKDEFVKYCPIPEGISMFLLNVNITGTQAFSRMESVLCTTMT